MAVSISCSTFMFKWYMIQKIYPKMYSTSCADNNHDVSKIINGMVWNIRNWISRPQHEFSVE